MAKLSAPAKHHAALAGLRLLEALFLCPSGSVLPAGPISADRFLILDGAELCHFGASLKDLGRQYCAVTKMDPMFIPSIMQRI